LTNKAPLGPKLIMPVAERLALGTPVATPIVTPPIPTPSAPADPEAQIETVCGGPPEMIILAVGSDLGGLADVTRVVRVDFVTPRISVIAFPRDLWVPIANLPPGPMQGLTGYFGIVPWIEEDQLGYGRINTAFRYGDVYDLPGGGPGTMADTLYLNFGLEVEHYASVKMESMGGLIDILGGIDIYVPYDVPGFTAGQQHMTGDQAVAYGRVRSTDNDWFRQDRQTLVLKSMREKLIQREAVGDLPRIIELGLKEVRTDLSREQITMLACAGIMIPEEDFMNYQITRDYITSARTTHGSYVLVPQYDRIAELIAKFMIGIPQDQPLP
jgi:LCP family protein required for cell wall assembly